MQLLPETWEIYDLSTDELVDQRDAVLSALAASPDHPKLLNLRDAILQEIDERRASEAILSGCCDYAYGGMYREEAAESEVREEVQEAGPSARDSEVGVELPELPSARWGVQVRGEPDIIVGVSCRKTSFNTNKPKKAKKPPPPSQTPPPPPPPSIPHAAPWKAPRPSSAGTRGSEEGRAVRKAVQRPPSAQGKGGEVRAGKGAVGEGEGHGAVWVAGVVAVLGTASAEAADEREEIDCRAHSSVALAACLVIPCIKLRHVSLSAVTAVVVAGTVSCLACRSASAKGAAIAAALAAAAASSPPPPSFSVAFLMAAISVLCCAHIESLPSPPPAPQPDSEERETLPPARRTRKPSARPLPLKVDYTRRFGGFTSLWHIYPRGNGTKPPELDEKELLEEAARELIAWAETVLAEGAAVPAEDEPPGDDSGDDDDGGARPNAPPKATRSLNSKGPALQGTALLAKLGYYLEDDTIEATLRDAGARMGYRAQRSREEVFELVCSTFDDMPSWDFLPASLANFVWTWRKPRIRTRYLLTLQRVNHYPNSAALTRKDLLKKSVQRFKRLPSRVGEAFDILPQTYVLPQEYTQFMEAVGQSPGQVKLQMMAGVASNRSVSTDPEDGDVWIMKPVGMSRGRGISLLTNTSQIVYGEAVVIQRYITNPLLLDGYKFDLRLYVVVLSFQPLVAFLSTLGFARFASVPFSSDRASLGNLFMHLTNTSVQAGQLPPPFCDVKNNCKWSLSHLADVLPSRTGVPWSVTWSRIQECILKCLAAAETSIPHQPSCFELFGFDVLLDSSSKPWVLEVNASPSMEIETPLDSEVKRALMREIVELVDPQPFDRFVLMEVVARRLRDLTAPSRKATFAATGRSVAEQTSDDLSAILNGNVPPPPGSPPSNIGHFEKLAPSPLYDRISRVMRL